MDKKLLDALNNLSVALQQIADSLDPKKKKVSSIGNALSATGTIDKRLKSIDAGIKQLQTDNKKILKNQQTILGMTNKEPKTSSPVDKAFDPKQRDRVKNGLGTILMIAVGVLAIGLAFKIIGNVNVLSVLAIALALPLIAMAFEKISQMKDLTPEQMKNLVKVTIGMATAITLSSWILAFVAPIGLAQMATSIAIAAMFTVVSYGLDNIIKNIKDIKPAQIKNLALVMTAVSLAIVGSSFILNFVVPVSAGQLITSILIAGMFTAVSYGLDKLLKGLGDIKTSDLANISLLPDIMVAISLSIVASSWVLQFVAPVGFFQLLTSVAIAAAFVIISHSIKPLMEGIKGVSLKDIAMGGLVLVSITLAIVAASWALMLMAPIEFSTVILFATTALAIAVSSVALAIAFKLINSIGQPMEYILGGISVVIIAGAIALSSQVLSLGNYKEGAYPGMGWALGVGMSLVIFGGASLLLGMLVMETGGMALAVLGLGAVAMGMVALTIAGISRTLQLGDYKEGSYPSASWSTGVSAAMIPLALGAIVIGGLMMTGIGAVALGAGVLGMVGLAKTVVYMSHLLSKGDYRKYPSLNWAKGVATSISSFGKIMSDIGLKGVILNAIGKLIGTGPVDLADQLVQVDKKLQEGTFDKFPSPEWADGVGNILAKFAELMVGGGFGGMTKQLLGGLFGTVGKTADAIVDVDKRLSKGDYIKYPTADWATGVANSIRTFSDISNFLDSGKFGNIDNSIDNMKKISDGYSELAKGLSKLGGELNKIDTDKLQALKNLTGSIVLMSLMDSDQFEKMMSALEDKAKIFVGVLNDLDAGESTKGLKAGTSAVKPGGSTGDNQRTINDLYSVMASVDSRLASIAKSNDNVSKYVDEIRTGESPLKKDKKK
jgi:hypothetical protein